MTLRRLLLGLVPLAASVHLFENKNQTDNKEPPLFQQDRVLDPEMMTYNNPTWAYETLIKK